ncbi:MAG TPA: NAD(P)H-dependent glycerol-3-phosphate dehydrogenase [Gemmatimonadaceae bacterium]|nr:NAD(P)H-dependent glycerol-3-phosphate dehydrogenase [Gemmatimonadaceae bacterium]
MAERCAVIGAGAWGTALADLLARSGNEVALWAREADVVESVNASHRNRFLGDHAIHQSVRAFADAGEAVRDARVAIFVTPSHALRPVAKTVRPALTKGTVVVIASKGVEENTLALMSDVATEELDSPPLVALSGPTFASEVAAGQPTAIVAASADEATALVAQRIFSGSNLRPYTHDDVIGVEVGGALKNVMAVATGIADGLGLGHNARAALITRGLAEMTRLGVSLGGKPATFAGLAGLGDLVLTCTGGLSRNRAVGVAVGKGASLADALAGRETVAEGVITTRSARALAAREGVEMPIVDAVYRVLFEGEPAREAMRGLMARGLRSEGD